MGLFSRKPEPKKIIVRRISSNLSGTHKRSRLPAKYSSPFVDKVAGRAFEGGRKTRLTESWNYGLHNNLNLDIRTYKTVLDERAEDFIKNNPYIAGYLLRETANVIGSQGFRLQLKTTFPDGTLDEFANTFIEKKFKKWCRREYCTMTGRISFVELQWMILNSLLSSGEYLLKKITNVPLDENPYSFSLEILDPRDIDITYSAILSEDRIVLMGVEIDRWRKIKGIHLKPNKLKDETVYSPGFSAYQFQRDFIPAKDLYFDFDSLTQFTIKQIRGFTPLSSAMLLMRAIDNWENATLTNAILTARKMGFLTRKNMEGQSFVGASVKNTDGKEIEKVDTDGGKYMDFEEGIVEELPYGYEFIGWDPKFPHEQHEMFVRNNLKKFATSRGVNYNSFANDYGGVTFSSLRAGAVDERDIWMLKQTQIIESFLIPFYNDWLYWSLLSQALAPLQFQNRARYEDFMWMPKRWKWVKPLEDVSAKEKSCANLFESPIQVAAELGNDYEEIIRDFEKIKKDAERLGITPQYLMKALASQPIDDFNDDEDEQALIDELDKQEEDEKKELIFNLGKK